MKRAKKTRKPFAEAFRAFAEFDLERTEQPSTSAVGKILVDRIRKIEAANQYKDPADLFARVEAQFKRYASTGDELSEPGPWSYWLVASAIDPEGALVLCANVVRAEIEGIMPSSWTAA